MSTAAVASAFPTVVHMLADAAARSPAAEALVAGTERLTYQEYWQAVGAFAGELADRNLAGERVALLMGNSIDLCIAMFAVHYAGATAVPLNPAYTPAELEPMLGVAAARLLIHDQAAAESAAALAPR
ncbi:MAG: AMP-binding protein, partial [Gammaproteobacteria bacterium]|nr:AMP-binding protein [Gammaproteobacteria bacterium]